MKPNRNPMKKTLLLAAAASLFGASHLMADVDLFITGSTAFRASCHDACKGLFVGGAPTEFTGTPATGGDSKTGNAAAQWTMTGTPIPSLTTISGTLTIHGLFTGSIQGPQTVEQGIKLIFLSKTGTMMTNTPTIAFSDSSTLVSPYPVDGVSFGEENVAVQPFVMVKSISTSPLMNSITNVTWDQLKTMIAVGRLPLSSWTHNGSDTNFIYLIERTKDSGTRRTETAEMGYAYNTGITVYNWDATNKLFYKGTNSLNGPVGGTGGGASIGVVGPAGNGNANLVWGPGYVGGGDIASVMKDNSANNLSIAFLSIGDAKGITGTPWSQVIPFNGVWPTAQGPAIAGATTNDYSTITLGSYSLWGFEVLAYPLVDPSSLYPDQNLTAAQLGDQNTVGTILGVLDDQTAGTPVVGSIQASIEATKPAGATAVRNSEMRVSRPIVGGPIIP
jgi:hypothetical protein